MTLLIREIGRFLFDSLLWVGMLVAITVALVGPLVVIRRADRPAHLTGIAFVGATGVASLAHRLGLPMVWAPRIGSRDLPVVWAAAGAIAVAITLFARYRKATAGS